MLNHLLTAGFLFTALSYFSYACWIAPNNAVVNELFGVSTGLGYGMLTFDWLQVAWIGNPLATPWWAQVNWLFGFLLFYWILVPVFYYANVSQKMRTAADLRYGILPSCPSTSSRRPTDTDSRTTFSTS